MSRGFGIVLAIVLFAFAAVIATQSTRPSFSNGGNETAAIVTLRNLASMQERFQSSRKCDLDGDGVGEFGTFGEMTGADGIRADATGALRKGTIAPTLLSAALAALDADGIVTKSGYCFRIFLPRKGGGSVNEGRFIGRGRRDSPSSPTNTAPAAPTPGSPFTGPVDVDASETRWCAYAWPVAKGNSGNRAFFVDQGGDVWHTANEAGRYSGLRAAPAWEAAMPAGGKAGWSPAPNAEEFIGRDGMLWKRTN